jgi:hypothetical protein
MMTKEQTELMTKTLAELRESEAALVSDLSIRVLDGTPFVLLGDFTPSGSERPITLVYGEWSGHGKCFRSLDIQPNHFGGVYTMSHENVKQNVARLAADNDCKMVNIRAQHIRTIKQDRLASIQSVIAHIAAVVEGGAR